jgi:hypothetical protein
MQDNKPDTALESSARPVLAGMLIIQAFLGYEWFMSGLAKALNGDFISGLGDQLTDTSKDLSGFPFLPSRSSTGPSSPTPSSSAIS